MRNISGNDYPHPREVADKSIKGHLKTAIDMALEIESEAVGHNTRAFNRNRYRATAGIPDYEELKRKVRKIKEEAIEDLPNLLSRLRVSVEANGGHFYLASDARDAGDHVARICREQGAARVVKAKSITTEEIRLNERLERDGIEVTETDLAEFILQVSGEQPSHIVAPAIHRSRERISELFREKFTPSRPLETGEELTKFARDILREKFLTADIGISGANLIAADSGTLLLVESEGNIRMVTQAPAIHIAIAGVEKVIPGRDAMWPFIELLAPSATGQSLTSYTHIIKPPLKIPSFSFDGREKKKREFHLVLVDNGRMNMRNDTIFRETLYCIRCSACMNVCANFQAVGGHAFGGQTYSGGIGGSWEAGTATLEKARFSELCTGCSRCVTECPVRIDIPWLNENLRNRLNGAGKPKAAHYLHRGPLSTEKNERNAPLQKQFFANYHLMAKWGSRLPVLFNAMSGIKPVRILLEKMFQMDRRRKWPAFTGQTLAGHYCYPGEKTTGLDGRKVFLHADLFTNFSRPEAGLAAIRVYKKIGIHITVGQKGNEGRDSLSQGLLATTRKRAGQTTAYLLEYVDQGYDIIVVEPSILALFRKDYKHFVKTEHFEKLNQNCFGVLEYLSLMARDNKINLDRYFDRRAIKQHPPVFYHSHCQYKSLGLDTLTVNLLENLGFRVNQSGVECCGMAGSFGYKSRFYDISRHVGEVLIGQITKFHAGAEKGITLSCGVSCHEQIGDLSGIPTIHPMELLARFLS